MAEEATPAESQTDDAEMSGARPMLDQPPTPQAPLPFDVFAEHGKTEKATKPDVQYVTYVDGDGEKRRCEVAAKRKDNSIDIIVNDGQISYRVDGVRRKQDDTQTANYYE